MESLPGLPDGWVRWTGPDEPGAVLVFRPDIFDGDRFPPACIPTISVAPGGTQRPGPQPGVRGGWTVTVTLEPLVVLARHRQPTEADAVETAIIEARAFTAGEVDLRAAYVDPREEYLAELESLVGPS